MITCAKTILGRANNIISHNELKKNKIRMPLPGFYFVGYLVYLHFPNCFNI